MLFPDDGITKGDLVDYYRQVAPAILPYLKERPLNMQRFPNGIDAQGFYQKQMPDYFPEWMDRVSVEVLGEGQRQTQVVCNDAATLVYLANQACVTPHAWLSRVDRLDYPDKLIFDFDPSADDFASVRSAALAMRALIDDLGLAPFVMTTGSRGLHIVIPLDQSLPFDDTRAFARDLAETLARRDPDHWTTEPRKDERRGRLFVDYLRNAYGQTAIPPYAVRAKAGAAVATPLEWDELADPDLNARSYTIRNVLRRIVTRPDPWQAFEHEARPLAPARRRLDEIKRQAK